MKSGLGVCLIVGCILPLQSQSVKWLQKSEKGFNVYYQEEDNANIDEYMRLFQEAKLAVTNFSDDTFRQDFKLYIHPNRSSLDAQWQKDWNMPGFKSECWMVASGTGLQMDLISPKQWENEACEHTYAQLDKTKKLILHELFHVYHGQINSSPDFSEVNNIDWFVEGFATYASGQCYTDRLKEVKNAISNNTIPISLDHFWTGKLRYGLSGSVVMFIDAHYGRAKLLSLLKVQSKQELLTVLKTTEEGLILSWKKFILQN